jgi:hypothetical protein
VWSVVVDVYVEIGVVSVEMRVVVDDAVDTGKLLLMECLASYSVMTTTPDY